MPRSSIAANAGRQIVSSSASYYDSQSYTTSQQPAPIEEKKQEPSYSRTDQIFTNKVMKQEPLKNIKEWAKLSTHCQHHPDELVRYFCRDDSEPLCGECVVLHSKHDFIKADFKAASQIRISLNGVIETVDVQTQLYQ